MKKCRHDDRGKAAVRDRTRTTPSAAGAALPADETVNARESLNPFAPLIVVLDRSERVVFVNEAAEYFFSRRASSVLGRPFAQLASDILLTSWVRDTHRKAIASADPSSFEIPPLKTRSTAWALHAFTQASGRLVLSGLPRAFAQPSPTGAPDHFGDLVNILSDPAAVINDRGCFVDWNCSLESTLQVDSRTLRNVHLLNLLPEHQYTHLLTALGERKYRTAKQDIELLTATGELCAFKIRTAPLRSAGDDARPATLLVLEKAVDPPPHPNLEAADGGCLEIVAEAAPFGLALYADRFLYVNPAVCRMTGYSRSELLRMSPTALGLQGQSGGSTRREVRLLTRGGRQRWFLISEKVVKHASQPARLLNMVDVTERKRRERILHEHATIDRLTRVYNRTGFERRMRGEIKRIDRYGGCLSLIMFDIDHFKQVNDIGGHQMGDRVLHDIAARIKKNIRGSDTIGRWGGEEFMILAPAMSIGDATGFAVKLRCCLTEYAIHGFGPITASFGVAQYHPRESIEAWIGRADAALYRAKRNGRNRVEAEGA